MANNLKARPMDAIVQEFASKGFGPATIRFMQDLAERNDKTLTNLGQIQAVAPIKGRTEGISITAANLNSDGTFNSTDNVHDGVSTLRTFQLSGSALLIDNAGFESALIGASVPGWQQGSATSISIDQGNPQAGKNSLKVTFAAQFQNAQAVRLYAVRPGDTFRISGWVRSDGTALPFIQLSIFDKNGNLLAGAGTPASNSAAWVFVQGTAVAPANSSYAQLALATNSNAAVQTAWFDSLQGSRTLTSFEVTPINTAGTPQSTTGLCTQHSAGSTRIDVASSIWQFGDGTVAYSSGFVDPGSLGTWYIYADDPGYAGGSVTYVTTAIPSVANAANGRLFFGKITTAAGTATSAGGGSGGGGPFSKAALA